MPEDKTIEIRFTLSGQKQDLKKSQLRVYSLQKSHTEMRLTTGIMLFFASFVIALIGLGLFIVEKTKEIDDD